MKKQQELQKKIDRILALYQNPGSKGEKEAAARAVKRIQSRLNSIRHYDPNIYKYDFPVFKK